ncbi:hypothetical protein FJR38_24255 [Anabaena sp. UHCC 0253]|uniref:hypothetical protein n=1 Tax=Anabaena sp. UHCC 0253 TaxID=2590019 RepID=UPI001448393A|nr:hypothetical protein [Anabaena sp. UHCC 0253]MTJ55559.1 hypothetical protein [Anabaena sp. UHCC 0253]
MQLSSVRVKYTTIDFTCQWIFATLLGFGCSLLMVEISEQPDMGILEAAMGSLAIALPQSYLLRKTITPVKWILSTILSWVIIAGIDIGVLGWTVASVNFLPVRILGGIITGGIGGLLIGISQWWLAIPPSFSSGWKWVFVTIISWMVAIPIGSSIGLFLRHITNLFFGEIVGLAITWLLVALLTGVAATRIIKDL